MSQVPVRGPFLHCMTQHTLLNLGYFNLNLNSFTSLSLSLTSFRGPLKFYLSLYLFSCLRSLCFFVLSSYQIIRTFHFELPTVSFYSPISPIYIGLVPLITFSQNPRTVNLWWFPVVRQYQRTISLSRPSVHISHELPNQTPLKK